MYITKRKGQEKKIYILILRIKGLMAAIDYKQTVFITWLLFRSSS